MDQNDLRTVATVLGFVVFLGIVWWAWGKGRQKDFDEAAALPLNDDDELDSVRPEGRRAN